MPRKLGSVLTAAHHFRIFFPPCSTAPRQSSLRMKGPVYLISGLGVSRRMLRKELSEEGKEEGMKREGERDGDFFIHIQPKLAFYSHPL